VTFGRGAHVCPREGEVLDLVAIGQWPDRADADLVAHARGCAVCGDLATAATAIAELRDTTVPLDVPDAAVVWGRAQLRAREEAARRAAQPLHLAHGLAFAALLGLGAAWWGLGAPWLTSWWGWLSGMVPDLRALASEAITAVANLPLPATADLPVPGYLVAMAVIAVLAVPVALYLAER
jgi:hypothetical protein